MRNEGRMAAFLAAAAAALVLMLFGTGILPTGQDVAAAEQEWAGVPRTRQAQDQEAAREFLRHVMNRQAVNYNTRIDAARVLLDSWRVCTW